MLGKFSNEVCISNMQTIPLSICGNLWLTILLVGITILGHLLVKGGLLFVECV